MLSANLSNTLVTYWLTVTCEVFEVQLFYTVSVNLWVLETVKKLHFLQFFQLHKIIQIGKWNIKLTYFKSVETIFKSSKVYE